MYQLAIGRVVQAFGAASVMSVGPGTIADVYRFEEGGTPMDIYFGVNSKIGIIIFFSSDFIIFFRGSY